MTECVRCDHPIVSRGERLNGSTIWIHDPTIPRYNPICPRACPPEDESTDLVCHPDNAEAAQQVLDQWVREGFWAHPPKLTLNPHCPRGTAYLNIAPVIEYILLDCTVDLPDPDEVQATCVITPVED